jgi:hypothetical protein
MAPSADKEEWAVPIEIPEGMMTALNRPWWRSHQQRGHADARRQPGDGHARAVPRVQQKEKRLALLIPLSLLRSMFGTD